MYALTRMSRGGIKWRLTGNDGVEETGRVPTRGQGYVDVVVQTVDCQVWRPPTTIRFVPCMGLIGF